MQQIVHLESRLAYTTLSHVDGINYKFMSYYCFVNVYCIRDVICSDS